MWKPDACPQGHRKNLVSIFGLLENQQKIRRKILIFTEMTKLQVIEKFKPLIAKKKNLNML